MELGAEETAAGAAAAGAASGAFAGAAAGADGAAPAAPSAIWPSSASRPTVSPFCATISVRTPEAGAGTSTVTLSVSSSTSGSSALTVSPTFFEPGSDSRFADGLAEGWYADFSGHDLVPFHQISVVKGAGGRVFTLPARLPGMPRAARGAWTSGPLLAMQQPDDPCNGPSGTSHRYGREPIPDKGR